MTEDEIRKVIVAVIHENNAMQREQFDAIALKTLASVLTAFGIEEDDRLEFRADMAHLRKWRRSVETVERVGWTTAVGVIVTGVLGVLWLGIKTALGK